MIISLLRDTDPLVRQQALDLLVRRNYNSFELQNVDIIMNDSQAPTAPMPANWCLPTA
jgi:hypothetical protein